MPPTPLQFMSSSVTSMADRERKATQGAVQTKTGARQHGLLTKLLSRQITPPAAHFTHSDSLQCTVTSKNWLSTANRNQLIPSACSDLTGCCCACMLP